MRGLEPLVCHARRLYTVRLPPMREEHVFAQLAGLDMLLTEVIVFLARRIFLTVFYAVIDPIVLHAMLDIF